MYRCFAKLEKARKIKVRARGVIRTHRQRSSISVWNSSFALKMYYFNAQVAPPGYLQCLQLLRGVNLPTHPQRVRPRGALQRHNTKQNVFRKMQKCTEQCQNNKGYFLTYSHVNLFKQCPQMQLLTLNKHDMGSLRNRTQFYFSRRSI